MNKLLVPRLIEHTTPATITLLSFKDPRVRALLHECKYHRNTHAVKLLAHTLSTFLTEYIIEQSAFGGMKMTLVPVPLSINRYKERGYNQVALVTSKVSAQCSIPQKTVLAKIKDTKSQTTLNRSERLRNQEGAFVCEHVSKTTTYVVVDDVLTTGATLTAALDALTKAGAVNIVPIALAH
jgi:ComF family protein